MKKGVLPSLNEIHRHPIRGWVRAVSINLEMLRLALIDEHRDAFEGAPFPSLDPSQWMAGAVEEQIGCLSRVLSLYEQALVCGQDVDIDF